MNNEVLLQAVVVKWKDAHSGGSHWQKLNEMIESEPYIVNSIGYVLNKNNGGKEKHISLAQSIGEDETVDSVIHIPTEIVISVTFIMEKKNNGNIRKDQKGNFVFPNKGLPKRESGGKTLA